MPTKKRVFDLVVCVTVSPFWIPVLLLSALVNMILNGFPVFYLSQRRVNHGKVLRLIKFRTMVKNADVIANRDTIPADNTKFLNIPIDSDLYTPFGRLLEKLCFTELPQLLHVLKGDMTLVGNRPLPENVFESIKAEYPPAAERYNTPAGLTGPIQLIGREELSDEQRLQLEIAYCHLCQRNYSIALDFLILLYTVLIPVRGVKGFKVGDLMSWMQKISGETLASDVAELQAVRRDTVVGQGAGESVSSCEKAVS